MQPTHFEQSQQANGQSWKNTHKEPKAVEGQKMVNLTMVDGIKKGSWE